MGLYRALWPLTRSLDAEEAHRLTIRALKMGAAVLWPPGPDAPSLRIDALGLRFANPLGIAAGFDKDGEAAAGLLALGFGFIELGTVTPRAQSGNEKSRLFRLEEDRAVINRMGFNNHGADALAARLSRARPAGVVGINIGANKDSKDRPADYVAAFKAVAPFADYITVNVSSPNTPGLRGLQASSELRELVGRLQEAREQGARALPLLVKISPDLDTNALSGICEVALGTGLDGLIISNTTTGGRAGLRGPNAEEAGGLSGAPLFQRSTEVLREAYKLTGGRMTLIGVGGVGSARDAYEKIRAGATLVQLYSGLVYEGPGLIRRIKAGLTSLLKADGFASLQEAIGAGAQPSASVRQAHAGSA